MTNNSALAFWRHNRYSRQNVLNVCDNIDNALAAKVELLPNRQINITLSTHVADTRQGHFPVCIRFMQDIVESWTGPELLGTFILWLEDGMWDWNSHYSREAPILAFGRRYDDPYTMLVPDPAFLGSRGYIAERNEIEAFEEEISWNSKQKTVFWRGASSGLGMNGPDWKSAARIRLAMASKEMNDPKKLDAKISTVVDYGDGRSNIEIPKMGIVGAPIPFTDFLKYRYLVDVDGQCCAWKSLFLKLSSKSVTLKVQSPYEQWYYRDIVPWEHYIPIKDDVSDIGQIIDWLHEHDKQCEQISRASRETMSKITYAAALADASKLVAEILSYCNDK